MRVAHLLTSHAQINFLRFALNTFYYGEFAGQVYNCTVGVDGYCDVRAWSLRV